MYSGARSSGPLPAHCRVDGVINRRKGAGGEEFGIGFALALPEKEAWNGDFLMQGGGGGNGVVAYPLGASYAGERQTTEGDGLFHLSAWVRAGNFLHYPV
jgi:hypothetical protein